MNQSHRKTREIFQLMEGRSGHSKTAKEEENQLWNKFYLSLLYVLIMGICFKYLFILNVGDLDIPKPSNIKTMTQLPYLSHNMLLMPIATTLLLFMSSYFPILFWHKADAKIQAKAVLIMKQIHITIPNFICVIVFYIIYNLHSPKKIPKHERQNHQKYLDNLGHDRFDFSGHFFCSILSLSMMINIVFMMRRMSPYLNKYFYHLVRILTIVLIISLFFSGFYTAFVYHHAAEAIAGTLMGIFYSYCTVRTHSLSKLIFMLFTFVLPRSLVSKNYIGRYVDLHIKK